MYKTVTQPHIDYRITLWDNAPDVHVDKDSVFKTEQHVLSKKIMWHRRHWCFKNKLINYT